MFTIYATEVTGQFKNQATDRWIPFETWTTRDQALRRCRTLIGPSQWQPRVYEVRDDETGRIVSKRYTNRPELLEVSE